MTPHQGKEGCNDQRNCDRCHASNFDSVEEQTKFKEDTSQFFLSLFGYHLLFAAINGMVYSRKSSLEVMNDLLSPVIGQFIFDKVVKSLFVITGVLGLLYSFTDLIIYPHLRFLLIDLILTVTGLFNQFMSIVLLMLNLIVAFVYGLIAGYLKF